MWWFGFWGQKTYTIGDIIKMVKDDEIIYIGEFEILIKKEDKILKKFEIYNPYGRKDCYTYIERESSD